MGTRGLQLLPFGSGCVEEDGTGWGDSNTFLKLTGTWLLCLRRSPRLDDARGEIQIMPEILALLFGGFGVAISGDAGLASWHAEGGRERKSLARKSPAASEKKNDGSTTGVRDPFGVLNVDPGENSIGLVGDCKSAKTFDPSRVGEGLWLSLPKSTAKSVGVVNAGDGDLGGVSSSIFSGG